MFCEHRRYVTKRNEQPTKIRGPTIKPQCVATHFDEQCKRACWTWSRGKSYYSIINYYIRQYWNVYSKLQWWLSCLYTHCEPIGSQVKFVAKIIVTVKHRGGQNKKVWRRNAQNSAWRVVSIHEVQPSAGCEGKCDWATNRITTNEPINAKFDQLVWDTEVLGLLNVTEVAFGIAPQHNGSKTVSIIPRFYLNLFVYRAHASAIYTLQMPIDDVWPGLCLYIVVTSTCRQPGV